MGGSRYEEPLSSSSKRRRPNDDYPKQKTCRPRREHHHLYLALDDWSGGYSIHMLDVDDILDQEPGTEHLLPAEPAAVRIASPGRSGPMAFAALGSNIFVSTNPRSHGDHAPPTMIYDTRTRALSVGPRVPYMLRDLSGAMAAGDALYVITSPCYPEYSSLQALSWASAAVVNRELWDPDMEWSWDAVPSSVPPPWDGIHVIAYALHPDRRTIFMSTGVRTHSFDTSEGVWKNLGDWVLPFRGQAYFDANLDAWVGHHLMVDAICCCPVASRSTATTRAPECKMLMEKLFCRKEEDPKYWTLLRGKETSLVYMGDSRFALFENILRSENFTHGSVLHITLFSLEYDRKGSCELRIGVPLDHMKCPRIHPCLLMQHSGFNLYLAHLFSHAAFWN